MQLEKWIARTHLDAATVESYTSIFASSPHAAAVLDGFLRTDKLAALQRWFSTEGNFQEVHTLWQEIAPNTYGSEEYVTAEAWSAQPEKRRAASEFRMVGPKPEYRLGLGTISHLRFIEMLKSSEFMDFLASVTGIKPVTLTGMQTRIMARGDRVGAHSDIGNGRALCAIFYLSDGWEPSFGGRFRHLSPGDQIGPVDPLSNRFVVFALRPGYKHDVEALTTAAAGWRRWSYTLWFGEPQDEGEVKTLS